MGFSIHFRCRNCNEDFSLNGLSMYYQTGRGEKVPLSHPGEQSNPDFRCHGIHGYSHDFVCLKCGKVYVVYLPFRDGPKWTDYFGEAEEDSIERAKRYRSSCECGNPLTYAISLHDLIETEGEAPCYNCEESALCMEAVHKS